MKLLMGYKVVNRLRGRYLSVLPCHDVPHKYWLNRWTYQRKGREWGSLAVFSQEVAARKYADSMMSWVGVYPIVFLCQYERSKGNGFLETPRWSPQHPRHCPDGTDFAERVMLLEEVS